MTLLIQIDKKILFSENRKQDFFIVGENSYISVV